LVRRRSPRRRCSAPAPPAEFSDFGRQPPCRMPLVQAFHFADLAGPAVASRACSFSPHQVAAVLPSCRGRAKHSSLAVPAAERWARDWQAPCPASTRHWAALATGRGSWMSLKMMLFSRHIDWRMHQGRDRHEHRMRQDEQSRHEDRRAPAPRNLAVAAARNAGRT
jgi:hypothetical protein